MKVLFITNQFGMFRHFEPVAEILAQQGHQIDFWFGGVKKHTITDKAVGEFILRHGRSHYKIINYKKRIWHEFSLSNFLRDLLGYQVYLIPGWTTDKYKEHHEQRMHLPARWAIKRTGVMQFLFSDTSLMLMEKLLHSLPPTLGAVLELGAASPDVLMVTSNLPWDAPELEYLAAARLLGIPSVLQVASWDNLSTKSTFKTFPDKILLWNRSLKEEAMELHRVPENKITVTGAATFDYLFIIKNESTYNEFCKKAGLKNNMPFVTYLGSSSSIAGDETRFVRDFVRCVYERIKAQVLIRPHPLNFQVWLNFEETGAIVFPKVGELPDTLNAKQDFMETIYHSNAVVGVNTSAMIETAILDRPCITIKSDQFAMSQSETSHFRHLSNGRFLEIAGSIDDAVAIIKNILDGNDSCREKRKSFVADFIRPNGLHEPVGSVIAEILMGIKRG